MDEQSMASWWERGLSGEDRDEWCTALDTGEVTEDLLVTLPAAYAQQLPAKLDDAGSLAGRLMDPQLQAFVAEECAKRLR
jgi:hypothetical protein